MTVRDSLRWFFSLALLAIIATLPEIYAVAQLTGTGATTDNNTVTRVGVRGAATRAFFFTPSSSSFNPARQDDYEDYFEDMDDSTVTLDDVFGASTPESAHSEKLSWKPPPPPPPADSDDLEPAPGQASLVIVFDGKMSGEWREFQREARNIVQELNAWDRIPIFNYIYVPFDDVSSKIVTRDEEKFLETVGQIKLLGEQSLMCSIVPILKAIEAGVESSLSRSFVLVFTGSLPSDLELESSVLQLIQEKQSAVHFLTTSNNNCAREANFQIYARIAEASNGLVLEQRREDLGETLRRLPEILNNQNVLLNVQKTPPFLSGFELIVDSNIKMITLAVSNRDTSFVITDPMGAEVQGEDLIPTANWRILKMANPAQGYWDINMRTIAEKTTIRVMGLSELILDFGFSQEPLQHFNQSSFSPCLGMKNILSIKAENVYSFGNLTVAKLSFPRNKEKAVEIPVTFNATSQLYVTGPFEPPRSKFQLSVHGHDQQGIVINRILAREMQAVIGNPPDLLFNEESLTITAGKSFKIICQIRSFGVASSLILKRDNEILKTAFSVNDPRIVHEPIFEEKDSGNYSCSARNEFGTRMKIMQRTITKRPSQMEILGDVIEGNPLLEIRCSPAEKEQLLWTLNGTKVESLLDKDSFELTGNSLMLKHVHRKMSGDYNCVANSSEESSLDVQFPVQRVSQQRTVILFELGKPITIDCGLIGNPKPAIRWLNREGFTLNDRQELITYSAEYRMDGLVMKCTGSNNLSQTPVPNEVLLKQSPIVEVVQNPEPVDQGKDVLFTCRGQPDENADINWTINGLDLDSFGTDVVHNGPLMSMQGVSPGDSLTVECVAETIFGTFKASKRVQVLPAAPPTPPLTTHTRSEAPKIDDESFADYYLLDEENDHIALNCRVTGIPGPRIYWTREERVMKEGPLLNITLSMEDGEYHCVAENSAGRAGKFLIVERQKAPVNAIEEVVHLKEGDTLNYSCPISRNRKVSPNDILWTNERLNYRGENLLLVHASPSDSGSYSCCLPKGSYCARVRVFVKPKRTQHGLTNRYVEVSPGQHVSLQCEGFFSFGARFEWWRSGKQLVDQAGALILSGAIDSEGAYKCLSSDEFNEWEVQYQVAFKQPPEISSISSEPANDSSVYNTFDCGATGHPQPVIGWLRDGTKVVSTTLIQYGKDMLIDSLRGGDLIVIRGDGHGYATKESPASFLLNHQPREEQFGLLQRDNDGNNNNRINLKWIVPRTSDATGAWTCVAMNKWGTTNQTINIPEAVRGPTLFNGEAGKENHAVVEALPLILECRVEGLPPNLHQLSWHKNGLALAGNTHRWAILDNGNKLIVWETKTSDAGTYDCLQENAGGVAKKSFHVFILKAPSYSNSQTRLAGRTAAVGDEDPLNKLTVLKGHSTVLHCPITGTPEPTITWQQLHIASNGSRAATPIYNEATNITVRPQEPTEFYQCSGASAMGGSQVLFHVVTESRPTIKNQNSVKLNPKLFSGILLPCWTEASPPANITWYRNTKLLMPSMRIRISVNSQVAKISNIRSEDNGVYSCVAKNYLGTASKTFSVHVSLPTLLSPWSTWSECNESCGLGTRHRTRECLFWNGDTASTNNTPQCAGDKLETEECLVKECPVDGSWSPWTAWSPCSATCKSNVVEAAPAIKYRHRDCTDPAPAFGGSPCKGPSYQQEICEVPFCPIDGGWSPFTDWSTCSATCGIGMQVRNRICNDPVPQFNGRECDGQAFEVKHCEGACSQLLALTAAAYQAPPLSPTTTTADWSAWSEWTECRATCGSGLMSRTRKCLNSVGDCAGENVEFLQCEGKLCEARFEEETYRWYFNPPQQTAHGGKYRATATASISSSSSSQEEEEEKVVEDGSAEEVGGPENTSFLPRSNYFNPQVSITLESSIPLTKDVSKIHFASAPAAQYHQPPPPSCGLGFEFRSGSCEDIDECTNDPAVCTPSQVCVNTLGGFACECQSGYEMFENAQKCIDIDECARRTHDCSHNCRNTPGSYYCDCPAGYLLSPTDFQTCTEDVGNKMELRNAPEEEAVFYVDDADHCPDGYALSNGRCEDVDECASLEEHCTTDQRCLNTNGGYVCLPTNCPESYAEKDDGTCWEACNATTPCASGAKLANTITYIVVPMDVVDASASNDAPIHKLVAYDDGNRALPHTSFHLQFNPANNQIFHLRQWKQGMALVYATELAEERIYKFVVYGRTMGEGEELLFLHKFIVYLYRRSVKGV